MRKLFGTDGIRGIANKYPLTIDICVKLAKAIAKNFRKNNDKRLEIIIGKDTRISGDMFEHILAATFSSLGINTHLIGICPTPAVSILTNYMKADCGIMISASHNHFSDNGIKIFNRDGLKLTDAEEEEIEEIMESLDNSDSIEIIGDKIGHIFVDSSALNPYIEKIKKSFSFDKQNSEKIKIVIDSSNGSFSNIAPNIFRDFGFDIVSIHDSPNGININESCGVTNPNIIATATIKNKADIGIAFDGDGDRLLLCDKFGRFLDGDHILAILAESSGLENSEIVSTIMANFGFEQYLKSKNIKLVRTKVGDRYISEYMRQSQQALFGGEPSGHIIIREHALTGDGLFAALKVLDYIVKVRKDISELQNIFTPYPVVNRNIKVTDKNIISEKKVVEKIDKYQHLLMNRGKLIVRPSGTEPLIRISAEGEDKNELDTIVNDLVNAIENV